LKAGLKLGRTRRVLAVPAGLAVGICALGLTRGRLRLVPALTWNIRFFHDRDRLRVDRIVNILDALNADVIPIGDWNKPPDAEEWRPLKNLESAGQVAFCGINDTSDFSHLMYRDQVRSPSGGTRFYFEQRGETGTFQDHC
jgi:hypothetical protein